MSRQPPRFSPPYRYYTWASSGVAVAARGGSGHGLILPFPIAPISPDWGRADLEKPSPGRVAPATLSAFLRQGASSKELSHRVVRIALDHAGMPRELIVDAISSRSRPRAHRRLPVAALPREEHT